MPTTKLVFNIDPGFSQSFNVECDEDGSVVLQTQALAEAAAAIIYCDAVDEGLVKASDEGLRFVRRVARVSLKSLLNQCRAEIEKTNQISDEALKGLGITKL